MGQGEERRASLARLCFPNRWPEVRRGGCSSAHALYLKSSLKASVCSCGSVLKLQGGIAEPGLEVREIAAADVEVEAGFRVRAMNDDRELGEACPGTAAGREVLGMQVEAAPPGEELVRNRALNAKHFQRR